jgi:DNA helicase INO80
MICIMKVSVELKMVKRSCTNYSLGEGNFDAENKTPGVATPVDGSSKSKKKGTSKKAKTVKEKLAIIDGGA